MGNELTRMDDGGFSSIAPRSETGASLAARASKEVEAMVIMAKRFPRDETAAMKRVEVACKRPMLARSALYQYPRGGQTVTGPSIRLAEVLAQNWGNIDFGWLELSRENGMSQCLSYAWDIETNLRRTIAFSVPHSRDTKNGRVALTDDRDIYEMCANMAARRMRACILNIIPGDIVEGAVERCADTVRESDKADLPRISAAIVKDFAENFSVTQKSLEKLVGPMAAWTSNDVFQLRKILTSCREGAEVSDYFADLPKPSAVIGKDKVKRIMALCKGKQKEAEATLATLGIKDVSSIMESQYDVVVSALEEVLNEPAKPAVSNVPQPGVVDPPSPDDDQMGFPEMMR